MRAGGKGVALRYRFGHAATAKILAAKHRLGSTSNACALRELLALGAALARHTADDGRLWLRHPGASRYDAVPVLGRDWKRELETGACADRTLTVYYESLLSQIANASNHLDTESLEDTILAMAGIGLAASHCHDACAVIVRHPGTGLEHVVRLVAAPRGKEEATSPDR
jgi:hypothetical protein